MCCKLFFRRGLFVATLGQKCDADPQPLVTGFRVHLAQQLMRGAQECRRRWIARCEQQGKGVAVVNST